RRGRSPGAPPPPLRPALEGRPRSAAAPRPALGGHGPLRGAARRDRPARAGDDAGPRRRPVGQGGLRRPRSHQGGPPRPRDDGGPRRGARALRRGRAPRRPRPPPAGQSPGLRPPPAGGHHRALPGGEPGPDGDAPAPPAEVLLRPGRPGRHHPSGTDHRPDGPPLSRPAGGPRAAPPPPPPARTAPPRPRRPPPLPGPSPPAAEWRPRRPCRGGGRLARSTA